MDLSNVSCWGEREEWNRGQLFIKPEEPFKSLVLDQRKDGGVRGRGRTGMVEVGGRRGGGRGGLLVPTRCQFSC